MLIAKGRVNTEQLIGVWLVIIVGSQGKKSADSNPTRWMTKSYYDLKKIEDRRDRQVITTTYYKYVKSFLHVPKNRFTAEGLVLHNENENMCAHAKDFIGLNRRIGDKKEIVLEDNADSVDNFF